MFVAPSSRGYSQEFIKLRYSGRESGQGAISYENISECALTKEAFNDERMFGIYI